MSYINRARSCIYGAMIGDALGSTMEFTTSEKAKEILEKYNNFKNGLVGKGPFNLKPGQITDDSEMAIAIMKAINQDGHYDPLTVAKEYHLWYCSNPFDIGTTTRNAVCAPNALKMMDNAIRINYDSMSNGFLMRQFGLVALYHNKKYDILTEAIVQDASLTHSNPEVPHMAICYGTILWCAIHGASTQKIMQIIEDLPNYTKSDLLKSIINSVNQNLEYFEYNGSKYCLSDLDGPNCGFAGFALWLTMRAIHKYKNYETAVLEVVSHGGDTDTNACIVGAVMGAMYPETIPKKWRHNLLFCKADRYKVYTNAEPTIWYYYLPTDKSVNP